MADAQKTAVVEEIANDRPAVGTSLRLRIRQQEILAELGVLSLQGTPFLELLHQTASLTGRRTRSRVLQSSGVSAAGSEIPGDRRCRLGT